MNSNEAIYSGENTTLKLNEAISYVNISFITMNLISFVYSLIFLVGVSGNILVVYVVCRKKSMQTTINLLILNLALSDLLICILAVPFTPMSFFHKYWFLGDFLCRFIPFTLCISVFVSSFTSLAIAINRYYISKYPFIPEMKPYRCVMVIILIWIVSSFISLPLAVFYIIKSNDDSNESEQRLCLERWPNMTTKRVFNVFAIVAQFVLPLIIISYCYGKVLVTLTNKIEIGQKKIEIERKKNMIHMLIAIVVIFTLCWTPLNIIHFIMEFDHSFIRNKYFSIIFFVTHAIAMSSTIYNPIMYLLNENFRREYHEVLPCLCPNVRPLLDQEFNADSLIMETK